MPSLGIIDLLLKTRSDLAHTIQKDEHKQKQNQIEYKAQGNFFITMNHKQFVLRKIQLVNVMGPKHLHFKNLKNKRAKKDVLLKDLILFFLMTDKED